MSRNSIKRTVSIRINPPKEFLSFLETCSIIYNHYITWCFVNHSYNKNKAHKELYLILRNQYSEIPSALIQTIRDNALESVKSTKFKHKSFKKPHSSIRYDKRTISLRNNQLSYSFFKSRIKEIISIPKFFKKRYKDWKFQSATINYNKFKKSFTANLTFEFNKPDSINDNNVLGIDRGLYHIISLSNGMNYKSNHIRKLKRRMLFNRRKIQAKGTHSAKRKLRKISGYEKRFILNENHKISKMIINLPYNIFALEELKNIRKQIKGKKLNNWLSNWSFFQLEQFIKYKAEILGKQTVKVDARYTSQKCNNCGNIEKQNRNKSHYICPLCGYREHADINAEKNIRDNYFLSIVHESEKIEQVECQSTNSSGKAGKSSKSRNKPLALC